jgi:hypothetical protein
MLQDDDGELVALITAVSPPYPYGRSGKGTDYWHRPYQQLQLMGASVQPQSAVCFIFDVSARGQLMSAVAIHFLNALCSSAVSSCRSLWKSPFM